MNDAFANPNQLHVELLRQLPGLIVVTSKNSQFMYSNKYTSNLFGYADEDSLIGRKPHDMLCPAVESADDFVAQNQFVLNTGSEITILDIHQYANGESKVLLTKKSPFKIGGEIIGSICHCTEMHSDALSKICATLIQSDKQYRSKQLGLQRSYTLGITTQDNPLSPRELDCVFYLMRGKTMKEIAQTLQISPRTVETYLEQARLKLGCTRKSDLVEYGLENGYLNYIPENILNKNISSIIHVL
jgi:DNA-binding CsgD family transcriptional regulator